MIPTPIFPPRLRDGDVVAVISPSWGGPHAFPRVFELGLRNLERILGVRVREYPGTRAPNEFLYRDPAARARDLHAAFADPEVRAIVASIGGDDSVRVLPHLDLPAFLERPKILMGYSDTTTLTSVLAQRGLVTFHGPAVMAGFAQAQHLPEGFSTHLRRMLRDPAAPPPYEPYSAWCDGYARWEDPEYDGEVAPLRENHEGWRWLQGEGAAVGRLYGGCLEVLEFMKSTPFWPAREFWTDRILFFETSEERPTVEQVRRMLRNYGSMGALERCAGLLFGRARGYRDDEKEALYEAILEVVAGEFGRADLPVVANLDFGHTDPQWVLPLNVLAEIECGSRTLRLLESPVV